MCCICLYACVSILLYANYWFLLLVDLHLLNNAGLPWSDNILVYFIYWISNLKFAGVRLSVAPFMECFWLYLFHNLNYLLLDEESGYCAAWTVGYVLMSLQRKSLCNFRHLFDTICYQLPFLCFCGDFRTMCMCASVSRLHVLWAESFCVKTSILFCFV